MKHTSLALIVALALPVMAQETATGVVETAAPSVSRADGLAAWERVFEVVSHPRCVNCHVGADGIPMWSGPSYGETRAHGMNIQAGESRIGAETLLCATCHTEREGVNDHPHAAPQFAGSWHLPPVEMAWWDKSSDEICAQLRNPDRNGGRDLAELVEHAGSDPLVGWAWTPGGTREAAPGSQAEHADDMERWGKAGFPCAGD